MATYRVPTALDLDLEEYRVLVVSDLRLLRDGLSDVLARWQDLRVSILVCSADDAFVTVLQARPHIVLIDAACPNGIDIVTRCHRADGKVRVIVFAVVETEEIILAWAEAGIAGYIPNTAGIVDLLPLLTKILRGEQICSSRVAACLLRRLAGGNSSGNITIEHLTSVLTTREIQIAQLVSTGLSNKEIARRLNIGLATAKSHVHNLLKKLRLQRRGQIAISMRELR
jgi:DNA-binding NarL/FixJ family response regulator